MVVSAFPPASCQRTRGLAPVCSQPDSVLRPWEGSALGIKKMETQPYPSEPMIMGGTLQGERGPLWDKRDCDLGLQSSTWAQFWDQSP